MNSHLIVLLISQLIAGAQATNWESLLKDFRPEHRIRAANALGIAGAVNAVNSLIATLDDKDAFVRSAVRDALVRIGRPAIDKLLSVVTSGKEIERGSAANGLVNLLLCRDKRDNNPALAPEVEKAVLVETSFVCCFQGACLESWVPPTYPRLCRLARISGRVWLSFLVTENGYPENLSGQGHPLLVQAASDAVRKWRFAVGSSGSQAKRWLLMEFELVEPAQDPDASVADMVLPNYVLVVSRLPVLNVGSER